ncbi:hypothetical protein [Xenorhabdus bovienii]|uniref:oxidoreductase n=1 Tax=Xenorhabdus bovienii TaxID=40576 RepID=UPI003DA59FAA
MRDFINLVKPITFGKNIIAPNRMYFSSVGFDLCDSMGRPRPEFFELYESIMGGGYGFGFLGNASVDPLSQYTDRSLKLVSYENAASLSPIFKTAKEQNFLLGIQLQHYGQYDQSPTPQHDDNGLKWNVTFLSEEQIETYINQFHYAACHALDIGAPSIQIHAANGYLLSNFLSPRTNHRRDRWGGNPVKRAHILLEIISRIRSSVQDRIAIFVRLQVDDGLDSSGLQVEQLNDVVAAIEEAGADAITCASGVAETFAKFLDNSEYTIASMRHAAHFLKKNTRLPIGFAANIDSLEIAEEILKSGDADFIGFGRSVIADHQFVLKELSGRSAEVQRCLWDSYCLKDKKEPLAERVFCCVNPRYLRPQHIQIKYQGEK